MYRKNTLTIVQQDLISKPVNQVFRALCNPDLMSRLWFAESDDSIKEGMIVRWEWPLTNTILDIKVEKIVRDKLISTVWQNSFVIVDYQFVKVDENHTLLSIKAYGFNENGGDLSLAMKEKSQDLKIALNRLKTYLASQAETAEPLEIY